MTRLRAPLMQTSTRAQGHAWVFAGGWTSWARHHLACGCPNSSGAGSRPRG